jgi:hypothetical protein
MYYHLANYLVGAKLFEKYPAVIPQKVHHETPERINKNSSFNYEFSRK